MKATIVKGVVACMLLALSGTAVAKDRDVDVLEGTFIVQCSSMVAGQQAGFNMLNAKRVEVHRDNPRHYLRVGTDNGVVYHYLVDGESCGIRNQNDLPAPASGGDTGR